MSELAKAVDVAQTLDDGGEADLCVAWLHLGNSILFSKDVMDAAGIKSTGDYSNVGLGRLFGLTSRDGKINFEVMAEAALQILSGKMKLPRGVKKLEGAIFEHAGLVLTARVDKRNLLVRLIDW